MENILILDGDPAASHRIAASLRSQDCLILEAATGLKAIQIGRWYGRLSLLIIDIDLPDFSGTSIAMALSRLFPFMPILFMSANAIAYWKKLDSNLRRFNSNLVDFMEKPFSAAELKMRVEQLIGHSMKKWIGKENQGKQVA